MDAAALETVASARRRIQEILSGRDQRLLVVVGPCSVHDVKAAREYAQRLAPIRERLKDCLLYTSPSPRDVEESRMPSSA